MELGAIAAGSTPKNMLLMNLSSIKGTGPVNAFTGGQATITVRLQGKTGEKDSDGDELVTARYLIVVASSYGEAEAKCEGHIAAHEYISNMSVNEGQVYIA